MVQHRAVFLDRDGVLVADRGCVRTINQLELCADVVSALQALRALAFRLVVVTNQAVVARGLLGTEELDQLHAQFQQQLAQLGAPIDAIYACPHHPHADVETYRLQCECRKPRPGLLVRAARDLKINLEQSYMVGDRPSDILAGKRAGCKTILIESGQHTAAPIVCDSDLSEVIPDIRVQNLQHGAAWIRQQEAIGRATNDAKHRRLDAA